MRINYFVGRNTGYKLTRTTYSRPSTLMVAKSKKQQLRVIEIGCAAGHNSLDILTNLNVAEFKAIDPYDTADDGYDDYSRSRLALMERQARQRRESMKTKSIGSRSCPQMRALICRGHMILFISMETTLLKM